MMMMMSCPRCKEFSLRIQMEVVARLQVLSLKLTWLMMYLLSMRRLKCHNSVVALAPTKVCQLEIGGGFLAMHQDTVPRH